jgi:hypothetical protein
MRPTIGIRGATLGANARSELPGSRDELAALAEQQAALRRVATLVARAASPSEVFSVVAEEMARCLKVANAEVCRYQENGAAIVAVGSFVESGLPDIPPGESLMCEGENVSGKVWRTGRPDRQLRTCPRLHRGTHA